MNIYESLNETVTLKKRFDLICDFPIDRREHLETTDEKKTYDLIKNVCSMTMNTEATSMFSKWLTAVRRQDSTQQESSRTTSYSSKVNRKVPSQRLRRSPALKFPWRFGKYSEPMNTSSTVTRAIPRTTSKRMFP